MDTDNSFEQIELKDQTTVRYFVLFYIISKKNQILQASNSSSSAQKGPLVEDVNMDIKKIKIEKSMPVQTDPTASNIDSASVQFVREGAIIQSFPEMTDEEILAYTLEFERKYKF